MDWLRSKVYNWFSPLFGMVIQDQVRQQLKQYYINQDEFMKKQEAHMIAVHNWMDQAAKMPDGKASEAALERIADALEKVKA